LRARLGSSNLREIEGAPGVHAVVHEGEPGSSGFFVIDALMPDQPRDPGVVYSVPDEDVMLIMPVVEEGGAAALASVIQFTFELSKAGVHPLSDQLYWRNSDGTIHLPTTVVEEGKSRRIHLDAGGDAEQLLRILGAME
ncbi:MAG TPA: hypothetical protein VG797_09265, partial [Phycisphaerales bacterium]|nr:hypothetical protein [Phycisphaerales bacterium]